MSQNKEHFQISRVIIEMKITLNYIHVCLVANRKYFLQAADLFHNLTCIRWKPRSSEVEAEVGHRGYTLVRKYGINKFHKKSYLRSTHNV